MSEFKDSSNSSNKSKREQPLFHRRPPIPQHEKTSIKLNSSSSSSSLEHPKSSCVSPVDQVLPTVGSAVSDGNSVEFNRETDDVISFKDRSSKASATASPRNEFHQGGEKLDVMNVEEPFEKNVPSEELLPIPKWEHFNTLCAGMGVGAVSLLSQRNAATFAKQIRRTGSVATQNSEFSYSSVLRPNSLAGHIGRTMSRSSNRGAPINQSPLTELPPTEMNGRFEGVVKGSSVMSQSSERRSAIDLMNRVWKPLGCAAQEVLTSEWEKRERLERDEVLQDALERQRENIQDFSTDDKVEDDDALD